MRDFVTKYRAVLVMVALAAIAVGAAASGALDDVSPETVRTWVLAAGPWGIVLFLVAFAAGELVHIPGICFVAGGVLVYGPLGGFLVGLVGAIFSVSVSFWIVRVFGGQALTKLRWRFVQKMLSRLDERPVKTIVMLRSVLWLAPALNFVLAMSPVRFSHYLIGSTVGLIGPIALMSVFFEQLLAFV